MDTKNKNVNLIKFKKNINSNIIYNKEFNKSLMPISIVETAYQNNCLKV